MESADEHGLVQNVAVDRLEHVVSGGFGRELELVVERKQLKRVVMPCREY
jgi:hypothetical protein